MSPFEVALREVLAGGNEARFRASGDSMYPSIRSGDYVRVVRCDPGELRKDDVVLALAARGLTAHRIVRFRGAGQERKIVLRGDNSLRSESSIPPESVLGRVILTEGDPKIRHFALKWATISRFAVVLARRLRSGFKH